MSTNGSSTAGADAVLYAFRRNVVVAASAGTGKTHRLTALYVLLALGLTSMGEDDDGRAAAAITPDRIVATTFSRAAAREIRDRVEGALRQIARCEEGAPLAFDEVIRARMSRTGTHLDAADLRKRAEEALAKWGAARIDTLHGVAADVTLGHALALGLPPAARVLDEEEGQAIGDAAVDETLGAALSGSAEEAEAARAIVSACSGVAFARQAITKLLDRLDEEGLAPADLALADHAGAARALAHELVRVTRDVAAGGSEPFRTPAVALTSTLAGFARAIDDGAVLPDEAVAQAIALLTARVPHKSKRTGADDALDEFRKALGNKTHGEKARQLVALLREAPLLAAREATIGRLLEQVRVRQRAMRRRAGALSFGDLLRGARDGLRDVPEVSRAVRGAIDVLLVDEFQDSSRVQRDLVYLLRETDEAAGMRAAGETPGAREIAGHGLFLVGDRKQSIYGFRGADVAVFSRICVELAGRAAAEALAIPMADADGPPPVADFIALRESRRSGQAVLDFVNAFSQRDFAGDRDGEARDYEVAYGPAEHLVGPPTNSGDGLPRGEVVLVRDDGAVPASAPPIVRDAAGAGREGFVAAAVVAREIAEGGAACRDIAVLARRRSTLPLVELALARLDIPYVVAGRALFDAREIRDVAAILRLLLDPRDRLALATVLRGPVVALSDASLAALSVPDRGLEVPLVRSVGDARARSADEREAEARMASLEGADRARLQAFRDRFEGLRRAAMRIPPAEAIRAAIEALDLDTTLAALPRPEQRLGNVDRLMGIARRRGGSLAGFARWLEGRIADEADEAEAAVFSPDDDAVRLTTIHASKGLGFPIVVLVDLNAEPRATHATVAFTPPGEGRQAALAIRHVGRDPERQADDLGPVTPMPIVTAALRAANAESRSREQAERCRLTYVAITRAKVRLVLVGSAAKARRSSALSTVMAGLDDPAFATAFTRVDDASALLDVAERSRGGGRVAPVVALPAVPVRPDRSTSRTLAVATTPLGLFRGCARRFRFRYLLGIDEPVSSGQLDLFGQAAEPVEADEREEGKDPRALGRAAHRALERWPLAEWGVAVDAAAVATMLAAEGLDAEDTSTTRIADGVARFLGGPYARSIRERGGVVQREEEIVLELEIPAANGRTERTIAIRGAVDLLVAHADGVVDVIDYKLSAPRADLGPYAFQLRTYALAAHRRFPEHRVRAGVLFLGSRDVPVLLPGSGADRSFTAEEHDAFERELGELGYRFAEARYAGRFEGVAEARCRELFCGFQAVCHEGAPKGRGRR